MGVTSRLTLTCLSDVPTEVLFKCLIYGFLCSVTTSASWNSVYAGTWNLIAWTLVFWALATHLGFRTNYFLLEATEIVHVEYLRVNFRRNYYFHLLRTRIAKSMIILCLIVWGMARLSHKLVHFHRQRVRTTIPANLLW